MLILSHPRGDQLPAISGPSYYQALSCRGYRIPYFDPCDGGVNARVLFLLEAPGAKAVASGFISRNNPDPSARMMCTSLTEAGLLRTDTILWNDVPWYVGGDSRIRAVIDSDLKSALPYFAELVGLLPRLKAVVLVGQKAQKIKTEIARLSNATVFASPHPSQRVMNRWPHCRVEMLNTFRSVKEFLHSGDTSVEPKICG